MYRIDYHGDDYAVSPNNSKRMLELIEMGKLNSISIIANMSYFDECMSMLIDKWDSFKIKPLISVHINLIDGLALSKGPVNANGNNSAIIANSWMDLFKVSLIHNKKYKELRLALTAEIKCQIKRVMDKLPSDLPLRLDSHVHTHMIPIVFDATMDAVKELGMENRLEFVRNSKEPLLMFLTTPGITCTFPLVNMIKNVILNVLGWRVAKKLRTKHLPSAMLWGLNMSGYMDAKRVDILTPAIQKYAEKRDCYLEILCHPGIALESESLPEYGPDDLKCFFSKDRDIEYEMIASR